MLEIGGAGEAGALEIGEAGKNEAFETDYLRIERNRFDSRLYGADFMFCFSRCLFGSLRPPYKKEAAGEIGVCRLHPGARFLIQWFESAESFLY